MKTKRNAFSASLMILLVAVMFIGLTGCGGSDKINEVKQESPVDSIRTYGEFTERYCPGGKWEQSSDASDFVNYIGGDSSDGSIDIQWTKTSSGWTVYAMEVEGKALSQTHINNLFLNGYYNNLVSSGY
jgi:hypothetical protein